MPTRRRGDWLRGGGRAPVDNKTRAIEKAFGKDEAMRKVLGDKGARTGEELQEGEMAQVIWNAAEAGPQVKLWYITVDGVQIGTGAAVPKGVEVTMYGVTQTVATMADAKDYVLVEYRKRNPGG